MKYDLKLNPDGTFPLYPELITGPNQTIQAIKIALRMWEGEWLLDEGAGLNYPGWIESLFRDLDAIGDEIRNEIVAINNVTRTENFKITKKPGRLVSITCDVYIVGQSEAVIIGIDIDQDETGNRRALVWDSQSSGAIAI